MNKLNILMNADDNLSLTEIINLMNNLIKLPRNDHFVKTIVGKVLTIDIDPSNDLIATIKTKI